LHDSIAEFRNETS